MPIGPGNPHQSASPLLTTNPTTLPQMSSVTFFESSDCENSLQFWEGASSGPATQYPRRERHPSTRPVFAGLDTPTPTGPACSGVPQTRRPQRCAPINHNSTRKDITIWNHQKPTHRRDSEDIAFGFLMTQTDILLQMPSNRTLVAMQFTPGLRASMPIRSAFRTCTFRT